MRLMTFVFLCVAVTAIACAQSVGVAAADYLTMKQQCGLFLGVPEIRSAVKPSAEQEAKWKDLFLKYADSQKAITNNVQGDSDAANDAAMKALEALAKTTADASILIATDKQRKRLQEIALHELGIDAFAKEDFLTDLKLLSSQKKRMKEILNDYQAKSEDQSEELGKRAQNIQDPTPGNDASLKLYQDQINAVLKDIKGSPSDPAVLRRETEKKVMSVLTTEQMSIYKRLLGKPLSSS